MLRGDVYRLEIELPDRDSEDEGLIARCKYIVTLQDESRFPSSNNVALLLVSTWRLSTIRSFEVFVGPTDGFRSESVIDCRWPYTITKTRLSAGEYQFSLTKDVMERVSRALVHGLQMN